MKGIHVGIARLNMVYAVTIERDVDANLGTGTVQRQLGNIQRREDRPKINLPVPCSSSYSCVSPWLWSGAHLVPDWDLDQSISSQKIAPV